MRPDLAVLYALKKSEISEGLFLRAKQTGGTHTNRRSTEMSDQEKDREKSRVNVRQRADEIKPYRCKYLIAVLENPHDIKNIGTVIRNVNALGVEKTYVVDSLKRLPEDWQEMRDRRSLMKTSVSAIKWSFVKTFDSTEACLQHLEQNRYTCYFAPC